MSTTLTVILGAGASHDLIGSRTAVVDDRYTPPLASDLFTPPPLEVREHGKHSDIAQAILESYPRANAGASTLALRGARPLEEALRSMADSQEMHIRRQFVQIPVYLRQLFREIGLPMGRYTSQPVNYNHLLSRILVSDFEQVALVTTNYDMFLERALTPITDVEFSDIESYADSPQWVLAKLHGSVSWVKRILLDARPGNLTLRAYLQHLDKITKSHDQDFQRVLDGEIRVHDAEDLWDGEGPVYPALVVPIRGKFGFVCPEPHLEILRQTLRTCPNFLIIGSSGQDDDLMELLRAEVKVASSLGIVSQKNPRAVYERFLAGVPAFG